MLEIGSLVDGKYKILSEIGHGGMSVVYMAINEKANKIAGDNGIGRVDTIENRMIGIKSREIYINNEKPTL